MCVRKQPASAAMLYNYARVQLSRDSRDGTSESCSWAQESLSSNNLRFHNEVCRVAGVLGHLGCGPGCWCCGRHAHGTLLGITDDVNPDVNPDVNMRPSCIFRHPVWEKRRQTTYNMARTLGSRTTALQALRDADLAGQTAVITGETRPSSSASTCNFL